MAKYSDQTKDNRIKLLLQGDSGIGKSSQLGWLVNAGYKVRLIDLDTNLAVLSSVIQNPETADLYIEQFPKDESSWEKIKKILDNWETQTENLGDPKSWGTDTVLAIDSGTFLCGVCLDKVLKDNNVQADKGNFDQSLWGVLAKRYENLVARLTGAAYSCHFVMTVHLNERENKMGVTKTQPYFMGRHLPKVLPSYFNNTWAIDQDKAGKRTLFTQTTNTFSMLRNSAPHLLKPSYVLKHGFNDATKDATDIGTLFRIMEKN